MQFPKKAFNSEQTPNIIKAAAIVIDSQRRLLIVRKKDQSIWISLGGKKEEGESLAEALVRELAEEISATPVDEPKLFDVSPVEPAAGKPGLTVQIYSYLTKIVGEPKLNPQDSIAEFHWLTRDEYDQKKYSLGSVLQESVIPKLIQEELF